MTTEDIELAQIRRSHVYLGRLAEENVGIVDPRKVLTSNHNCRGFGPDPALRKLKSGLVAVKLP